jgi:outer membrane murein-binding lipoprotein Lpp
MMKPVRILPLLALLAVGFISTSSAQQSDFAIKQEFDRTYKSIFARAEAAGSVSTLDSLKAEIDSLESKFASHADFLDKAIYPDTYLDRIRSLRTIHSLTYEKVYLIQTQGVKVEELETKIIYLTSKLDTLSSQRDKLIAELQEAKKSNAQYREIVRRLQANLQAKDRLIFALVDSIFLPYGKDNAQTGDLQREAINRKLEKGNIIARVEAIAGDNATFLSVTQLQPKDFTSAIEQYQQFANRWNGLRDKITAAVVAGTKYATPAAGGVKGTPGTAAPPPEMPGAKVDSLTALWGSRLQTMFWTSIGKEFTDKGILIDPFHDGPSFAASVRKYAAGLKSSGNDPSTFVNDIWKGRIDKEWRDALTKSAMLGASEYAALDRDISELHRPMVDLKFILYSALVILLAVAGWWFFARKPKESAPEEPKKG